MDRLEALTHLTLGVIFLVTVALPYYLKGEHAS